MECARLSVTKLGQATLKQLSRPVCTPNRSQGGRALTKESKFHQFLCLHNLSALIHSQCLPSTQAVTT